MIGSEVHTTTTFLRNREQNDFHFLLTHFYFLIEPNNDNEKSIIRRGGSVTSEGIVYLDHPHHHPLYHHDHHHLPGTDQPRRGSWRPRPGKDEEVQRLPQGKNHHHHHRPHPHNHIFLTFNPGQICSRVLISVNLLLLLPLSPGFARSCYINFSTFSGP